MHLTLDGIISEINKTCEHLKTATEEKAVVNSIKFLISLAKEEDDKNSNTTKKFKESLPKSMENFRS